MNQRQKELLHKRRFLLENPTAHLEQMVELEASEVIEVDDVRASRLLLQNPYAYLDGEGGLTASKPQALNEMKRSYEEIEQLAISIQRRLWVERSRLWRDRSSLSPVDVLDPAMAARLLGFELTYEESLGVYVDRSEKIRVAGILDRDSGAIRVSKEFPLATQRFTGAHEIGHVVLHPHMTVVHRDRALDGGQVARERLELEADKFAAYFLLPEKIIRQEFEDRFLTDDFRLNEASAFALGKLKAGVDFRSQRSVSRFLATAIQFNGKFFRSLSEAFSVTPETMAIRLEELRLVTRNWAG